MKGHSNLDMASTLQHEPTGFFDLPLELRQLVYEQLFPPNKEVNLSKTGGQVRRDIRSICQSDRRVREELISWENERYTIAHFMVTPGMWEQPERFCDYENLEWINIAIDHYDMSQSCIEKVFQIWHMRDNLERFVRSITSYYVQNKRMPNVFVKFRQRHRETRRGDLHWCKPLDWDQSSTGDLLATIDGTVQSETIFTHLLEPLLALPPCRKARIKVLVILHGCGPEDYELDHSRLDDEDLDHDHWYAKSFCEMMEAWLEGRISKDTPFESQWGRYRRAGWRGCNDAEYNNMRTMLHDKKRVVRDKTG